MLALLACASFACSGGDGGTSRLPGGGGLGSGGLGTGGLGADNGGSGAVGAGGGAGGGFHFGGCAAVSQRADNRLRPADVVFVADPNFGTPEPFAQTQTAMNAFAQRVRDAGLDVRVTLFSSEQVKTNLIESGLCIAAPLGSGSCPDDSRVPEYFHYPHHPAPSGDPVPELIGNLDEWSVYLRPEASKAFVLIFGFDVLHGDGGDAYSAAEAPAAATERVAALRGMDARFANAVVHGIYAFADCPYPDDLWNTGGGLGEGRVYREMVQMTAGVSGDFCDFDFEPVFDAIADSVVTSAGVDCRWGIPKPPPGEVFARDLVNVRYTPGTGGDATDIFYVGDAGACGAAGGWYYDDAEAPTEVLACPATCDVIQVDGRAQVDVLFGCETQGPQ